MIFSFIFIFEKKIYILSKTNINKMRRNRRLMRQRAMEAMTGDSHIDRVSRVMFPLTFFLFNVIYWFAYLSHRQAEIVHNTVDHRNDHPIEPENIMAEGL
jgi:hypothetical protein